MTWNWSHTQEAYDNVYYNISQLSLETLQIIAAEIHTYEMLISFENQIRKCTGEEEFVNEGNSSLWFDKDLFARLLISKQSYYTLENLVDFIFKFASEQAECTNGGHEAFVCPYGCHLVSFSREQ
jgi:hypothetical protein